MITIIDYGMGNLRSVQKAFQKLKIPAEISSDPKTIMDAKKLLLPGVGHFLQGVQNLKRSGLIDILNEKVVQHRTPVLGICLGMQLMTNYSEEGDSPGLGWIDAETYRFKKTGMKIPHMGWNSTVATAGKTIAAGISSADLFYFVHSYYVKCNQESDIAFRTQYVGEEFVSGFQTGNIMGTQFHPEKSYRAGMTVLTNFANI